VARRVRDGDDDRDRRDTDNILVAQSIGPPPTGAIEEELRKDSYRRPFITANAGSLVVHLVNKEPPSDPASPRHDMAITDATGRTLAVSDDVQPGHDLVFTVDAVPPGSYQFHCTIDGHEAAGMKGTLTITPAKPRPETDGPRVAAAARRTERPNVVPATCSRARLACRCGPAGLAV
jgi:hypothetical protein